MAMTIDDARNKRLKDFVPDQLITRAYNGLRKAGLHTLGDVEQQTEEELLTHPDFGHYGLNQIKNLLWSHGLTFANGPFPEPLHRPPPLSQHFPQLLGGELERLLAPIPYAQALELKREVQSLCDRILADLAHGGQWWTDPSEQGTAFYWEPTEQAAATFSWLPNKIRLLPGHFVEAFKRHLDMDRALTGELLPRQEVQQQCRAALLAWRDAIERVEVLLGAIAGTKPRED